MTTSQFSQLHRDDESPDLRGPHRAVTQFRHLLETLPAAAYICDARGLITYFNKHAVDLWGRSPLLNDSADRYCGSFRLFSVDGAPISHEECWMALALRQGKEYNGHEIVIERPDGSRRTVLANVKPVCDENGARSGAVNVLVDITAQKQAEALLRRADNRKNEFLAMLAHELRNPLAPMSNALEILRTPEGDCEQTSAAIAMIERQLRHLSRIVDDLLDVARITRDKLELRKERVDLTSVLSHAVETCRPLAESFGHCLDVAIPNEPLLVEADSVRLVQVFSNLLTNACRYTNRDGSISLSARRQGGEIVVSVKDDGIGIPRAMLTRVFDIFTQGKKNSEQSETGLGVGLALVKRLVELHGGTVEALSEGSGHGSEFLVRLPAAQSGAPRVDASGAARPNERRSGVGRRILVVDDNRDAADSLSLLLQLSGNETSVAHDGPSALEAATAFRPDVILLDLGLPGMNGHAVCQALRSRASGSEIVIIALTGWGREQDVRASRDAGFDHHLVKPVDRATLMRLLDATPTKTAASKL